METKNIDIAEILGNAPKGMVVRLYSPMLGYCTLERFDRNHVWVKTDDGLRYTFRHNGTYFKDMGECLLFPTPAQTWDDWQSYIFEDGCFIADIDTGEVRLYKGDGKIQKGDGAVIRTMRLDGYRFATMDEIQKFLNTLLDNGMKFDTKSKTIMPRVQPKSGETIQVSISRIETSEKQLKCYELTKEQYDVVKVVLDYVTNKR